MPPQLFFFLNITLIILTLTSTDKQNDRANTIQALPTSFIILRHYYGFMGKNFVFRNGRRQFHGSFSSSIFDKLYHKYIPAKVNPLPDDKF